MKRLIALLFFVALFSLTPGPAFAQNVRVRGYSIVLLLGDTQGSSMPESLSAPAKKALNDVKDFLPYRSYRVLDTQWIAGADSGARSSGFLRGLDDAPMPFTLTTTPVNQGFRLFGADKTTVLLDTAFTERPGETVVVGTSRVQGNRALIVLLSIVTDTSGGSVYEMGTSGVTLPVPITKTKPVYTQEALKARVAGVVRVSGIVRADGTLTDATVVSGLDPDYGLNEQAVKTVSAWTFKPGMKDGKPVDVRVTIDTEFTLGR